MGDGVGTVGPGHLDQVLHDDRARQGRYQRVAVLVERVGLQCGADEVTGELLTTIDDDGVNGARPQGTGLERFPVAALAQVGGHGDDLDAQFLDHPPDGNGGVQAPAVGEDYSVRHG